MDGRLRLAVLGVAAAVAVVAAFAIGRATSVVGGPKPTATSAVGPATAGPISTTPTTTTTSPPASTMVLTTTTTVKLSAATAVVGPDTVAGLALGATKAQVLAVLGKPAVTEQATDVGGAKYESLSWRFSGNGGLTLSFRPYSRFAPGLSDWIATAAGPRTAAGVQVGDPAAEVVSAYGALQPFCCSVKVGSVEKGGGRMIVAVDDATGKVVDITGGEEAAWSRSIAD